MTTEIIQFFKGYLPTAPVFEEKTFADYLSNVSYIF